MKIAKTRFRISFSLVCILVSVMLLAIVLEVLPDRRREVLDGRATLCEAVAVNASVLVSRQDLHRLEMILKTVVKRKDAVLSAAVRREDSELLVEVGDHGNQWERLPEDRSNETQVQVPIWAGEERWGTIEMKFAPLDPPGVIGLFRNPHMRLIVFVASTSFLLVYFYLGRMLRHLDPSRAVPGHVRSALDTMAEGLLILDKKGQIVLANHSFAATLGRPPDDLLGHDAAKLPWSVGQEDGPAQPYPWQQVLEGSAPDSKTMLRLRMREKTRTFMANCSGISGAKGGLRGVLVSLDDVTELQQQELELRESKAAADAANRAKSEFLANMSHEIRTPMNAILGFADALRRGLAENEQQRQEYLRTIHTSGKFLLELINDTLDLSKIEAGRLDVERIPCSPHRLISEVVDVLGIRAGECNLELDYATAGPIPETIQSDPTRLRQILTNLVGNAIKFTEEGGIKVVARIASECEPPKLIIEVADTGIGIAAEKLESVFDPFVQADAATTRRFGGSGLGLAISRRLALALGGNLNVRSKPGEGSTFTLTIDTGPLDGVELLDDRQFRQRSKPASQLARMDIQALPSARVLVVDDGEPNRRLIRLVLERAGVRVQTATNGQEAVELVSNRDFDIVLMDMQMPVMDGYTATTRLRQQGVTLPIIALTANTMHGDEEKCRAAGCTGFLGKPVDLDELIRTVAAELDSRMPEESGDQYAGKVDARATCEVRRSSHSQQVGRIADPSHDSRARRGSPVPAATRHRQVSPSSSKTLGPAKYEVGRHTHNEASQEPPEMARQCVPRQKPGNKVVRKVQSGTRPPVMSSLPLDDPEFRQIVLGFLPRLQEQLAEMDVAWRRRDLDALARLAHWLKGAAGTVGFDAFTKPAQSLEKRAKGGDETDGIAELLKELRELADAIVIPALEQCVS